MKKLMNWLGDRWISLVLFFREEERYGYMCAVDYHYEIGQAPGGIDVYRDIKDIKSKRTCVDECGIVKVKISMVKLVQKPKPFSRRS